MLTKKYANYVEFRNAKNMLELELLLRSNQDGKDQTQLDLLNTVIQQLSNAKENRLKKTFDKFGYVEKYQITDNNGNIIEIQPFRMSLDTIADLISAGLSPNIIYQSKSGVGKSLLPKMIADNLHGSFERFQANPSTGPSELFGSWGLRAKNGGTENVWITNTICGKALTQAVEDSNHHIVIWAGVEILLPKPSVLKSGNS